jgi:hypothetical protein
MMTDHNLCDKPECAWVKILSYLIPFSDED